MTTPNAPIVIPADSQAWLGHVEMRNPYMVGDVHIAPVFGFKYENNGLTPLLYQPQLAAHVEDGVVTRADGVHNAARYFLTDPGMTICNCNQINEPTVQSDETGAYLVPLSAHDDSCPFVIEWGTRRRQPPNE